MRGRMLAGAMLAIVLAVATSWGQAAPQSESWDPAQTPATKTPAAQGSAPSSTDKSMSGMQHQHSAQGMQAMSAMHQQHMQQMQADLQKMHMLLTEMRTNVTTMDPKDQPPMMSNIQLWQLMLDHLDSMLEHMQSMGSGMAGHEGMMQHQPPAKKKSK